MEKTAFPGGIDEQMPAIDGSHVGERQLTAGYCQLKRSMVYKVGNVAVVSLIRDCAVVKIERYAPSIGVVVGGHPMPIR